MTRLTASIKPHQVSLAFFRLQFLGNLHSLAFVVIQWTNPHPMSGRTGEFDHIGGVVFVLKMFFELQRFFLFAESANLHAPASTFVNRLRRGVDINAHLRGSWP